MSFNKLSPELVSCIFESLPKWNLPAISLVSHRWRAIAFSLLNHTVALLNVEHTNDFMRRVLAEGDYDKGQHEIFNVDGLQLSGCVRRLIVISAVNNEGLADFGRAVSNARNLEYLDWEMEEQIFEKLNDTLRLIHQNLPKLASLRLVMPGPGSLLVDQPDNVVALTNLRELSITLTSPPALNGNGVAELPEQLVALVRGASNIQSLDLLTYEYEASDSSWPGTDIFSALAEAAFPNLRALWANSQSLVPRDSLDISVLRAFLGNHPQIQTICLPPFGLLSGKPISVPPPMMDPNEMVALLPSVRHFDGPFIMVEALLKSKLAGQIESLTIAGSDPEDFGSLEELLPRIRELTSGLPQLQKLECRSMSMTWDNILIGLKEMMAMAPRLSELVVDGPPEEQTFVQAEWMEALKFAPQLRSLTVSSPPPCSLGKGQDQDAKSVFLRIGSYCSQLGAVHNVAEHAWVGRWDIIRRDGVPSDVVYVADTYYDPDPPSGWTHGVLNNTDVPQQDWRVNIACGYSRFYA